MRYSPEPWFSLHPAWKLIECHLRVSWGDHPHQVNGEWRWILPAIYQRCQQKQAIKPNKHSVVKWRNWNCSRLIKWRIKPKVSYLSLLIHGTGLEKTQWKTFLKRRVFKKSSTYRTCRGVGECMLPCCLPLHLTQTNGNLPLRATISTLWCNVRLNRFCA